MQFSLRTVRQYQKLIKSKRSILQAENDQPQNDIIISNSLIENPRFKPETQELKSYQDNHLFKIHLNTTQSSTEPLRKPAFNRQKTQIDQYEPFSRRRDIRRLSNISYQSQKTQRSEKTRMALQDLRKIGEICINNFEKNPEISVRFNKDLECRPDEQPFRRWRTLTREKSRNSKSPVKGKISGGKRAKNSPKKGSINLRVRKFIINKYKTSTCTLNISTIQSSNLSVQDFKPARRKSSITPWETGLQGVN